MSAPPTKKSGMSLYADLLNPGKDQSQLGGGGGNIISGAPVRYDLKKASADEEARKKDGTVFKPANAARRPQAQQKNKAKSNNSSSSGHKSSSSTVTPGLGAASSPPKQPDISSTPSNQPSIQGSNFENWVADGDDFYYERPKHERGGRKKKNKKTKPVTRIWEWDDIYDPTLPNNYGDYKGSDEQVQEVNDWKERLYFHRRNNGTSRSESIDDGERRPVNRMFAPPNMKFAPPTSFDNDARLPPPPPPPRTLPADIAAKKAAAEAKIAEFKAKIAAGRAAGVNAPSPSPVPTAASGPPVRSTSPPPPPPPTEDIGPTISRAPVRYSAPPADANADTMKDADLPDSEQSDAPRSSRPGQKDFAKRLMMKMGWEKGQGLGAQGDGITTALIAQATKRKKLPDSQGGGWAAPATGKIVGGKKRKIEDTRDDDGAHGQMSPVIKLVGMLEGLDVDQEIQKDLSLFQEIGDYMQKEFGNVERVFVWRRESGGNDDVFVKFTAQLSALRAVNATDGMTFAGNNVVARFFDEQKFEGGEYA